MKGSVASKFFLIFLKEGAHPCFYLNIELFSKFFIIGYIICLSLQWQSSQNLGYSGSK
jgi:hypothetical protein